MSSALDPPRVSRPCLPSRPMESAFQAALHETVRNGRALDGPRRGPYGPTRTCELLTIAEMESLPQNPCDTRVLCRFTRVPLGVWPEREIRVSIRFYWLQGRDLNRPPSRGLRSLTGASARSLQRPLRGLLPPPSRGEPSGRGNLPVPPHPFDRSGLPIPPPPDDSKAAPRGGGFEESLVGSRGGI